MSERARSDLSLDFEQDGIQYTMELEFDKKDYYSVDAEKKKDERTLSCQINVLGKKLHSQNTLRVTLYPVYCAT